jgi:hypothetical protein
MSHRNDEKIRRAFAAILVMHQSALLVMRPTLKDAIVLRILAPILDKLDAL